MSKRGTAMPFFEIQGAALKLVKSTNFTVEKDLQALIEQNLGTIFNCRFVATEFSTGAEHAGRIDTLALSEDNNPVIIEYKKVESSELINQSLYYAAWIHDHKGDFQVAVHKALGLSIEVDWSEVRIICLAPGYKKFDLHAVKVMGANIELWQYRLLENGHLYIDEIFKKSTYGASAAMQNSKNLSYTAASKKVAPVQYTVDEHLNDMSDVTKEIVRELREFLLGLDESVAEVPKKFYIAYKMTQNFVCIQTAKNKVTLFLKLDSKEIEALPPNGRDVSNIGHYGTGNFQLVLKDVSEVNSAKLYIEKAFRNVGG
jgi:predicted transport protein